MFRWGVRCTDQWQYQGFRPLLHAQLLVVSWARRFGLGDSGSGLQQPVGGPDLPSHSLWGRVSQKSGWKGRCCPRSLLWEDGSEQRLKSHRFFPLSNGLLLGIPWCAGQPLEGHKAGRPRETCGILWRSPAQRGPDIYHWYLAQQQLACGRGWRMVMWRIRAGLFGWEALWWWQDRNSSCLGESLCMLSLLVVVEAMKWALFLDEKVLNVLIHLNPERQLMCQMLPNGCSKVKA